VDVLGVPDFVNAHVLGVTPQKRRGPPFEGDFSGAFRKSWHESNNLGGCVLVTNRLLPRFAAAQLLPHPTAVIRRSALLDPVVLGADDRDVFADDWIRWRHLVEKRLVSSKRSV
jgi:hypothetical protein